VAHLIPSANSAAFLRGLSGKKLFTAEIAENGRRGRKEQH